MFFSAKQYMDHLTNNAIRLAPTSGPIFQLAGIGYDKNGFYIGGNNLPTTPLTEEIVQKGLDNLKDALIKRRTQLNGVHIGKWTRPWDVVPELATFAPPEGDVGVGVEVELGFKTMENASFVAAHIADWEYVTLDYEGPAHPIEATFAPELLSNIDNMLAVKYLDFLANNESIIYNHAPHSMTGTHVNISLPNHRNIRFDCAQVNHLIMQTLSYDEKVKYFGREPYGCGNNFGRFIEWKLFNSQTDSARLKQYINVATELTKLAAMPREQITATTLREALERGYNMPVTARVVEPAVVEEASATPRRRRRAA